MKKQLLSFVTFTTFYVAAFAQPAIQWIKDFGGTNIDRGYCVVAEANNTYVVAGLSISTDGNSSGNHGANYDAVVIKFDGNGNVIWDESFGGTQAEGGSYIAKASGGGYWIMANTISVDSSGTEQVTGGHGNYDWWIVRINANGGFMWGKCVGSSLADGIAGICGTSDGGCVATGSAGQKDKDFATGGDCWAVKLNSSGSIVWKSTYGTPGTSDILKVPIETKDGQIMIAGATNSAIGGNHGGQDMWALKVQNSNGALIWQKCFGGTGNEQALTVAQLADESYIMCGITGSNDGDFGTLIGGAYDGAAVRFDKDGNVIWAKTYGGNTDDEFLGVTPTSDGGFFFGGDTRSTDLPNVTGTWHGHDDMWLVKTDANGVSQWQKLIGGGSYDYAWSTAQGTDGGLVAAGYTKSTDGDLATAALGNMDYMVVKIAPDPSGVTYSNAVERVSVFPNPFSETTYLYISNTGTNCSYDMEVYDIAGNLVRKINISSCTTAIEREYLAAGSYFYKLVETTSKETVSTSRFVVY